MPHLLCGRAQCVMAEIVPSLVPFLKPGRSSRNNKGFRMGSPRNRQLGLGIEEMQAASLRRKADLVAARNRALRRHAGGGNAGTAYPGLQQDLGAELLDDLDAGIEIEARGAIAEREMLRPYAH